MTHLPCSFVLADALVAVAVDQAAYYVDLARLQVMQLIGRVSRQVDKCILPRSTGQGQAFDINGLPGGSDALNNRKRDKPKLQNSILSFKKDVEFSS